MKPTLVLDFDGVIHSHTSGWQGASVIPDPPVAGAAEAIKAYMEHFTVCVHSARFNAANADKARERGEVDPKEAVAKWLIAHGIGPISAQHDDIAILECAVNLFATKPPGHVTIDDRALTFTGTWPDVASLRAFQPWTRTTPLERVHDALAAAAHALNELADTDPDLADYANDVLDDIEDMQVDIRDRYPVRSS